MLKYKMQYLQGVPKKHSKDVSNLNFKSLEFFGGTPCTSQILILFFKVKITVLSAPRCFMEQITGVDTSGGQLRCYATVASQSDLEEVSYSWQAIIDAENTSRIDHFETHRNFTSINISPQYHSYR